jgi:hypothetical protein
MQTEDLALFLIIKGYGGVEIFPYVFLNSALDGSE